jgi:hypothetical protein
MPIHPGIASACLTFRPPDGRPFIAVISGRFKVRRLHRLDRRRRRALRLGVTQILDCHEHVVDGQNG